MHWTVKQVFQNVKPFPGLVLPFPALPEIHNDSDQNVQRLIPSASSLVRLISPSGTVINISQVAPTRISTTCPP